MPDQYSENSSRIVLISVCFVTVFQCSSCFHFVFCVFICCHSIDLSQLVAFWTTPQLSCRHRGDQTMLLADFLKILYPFSIDWPYLATYLYLLVGAVDHGYEHVEKDHHHGDIVDAVQHVANVFYELMVVLQHHWDHFRQPEDRPEQSLETLLHSAKESNNVAVRNMTGKTCIKAHCVSS